MKKILTATTALVAVGFAGGAANAAEPLTASVGGYMYLGVGFADIDNPGDANDQDGFGVLRDGEIYFNVTGSSDNGLTFNGHVQLEAFSSGDQIDENWGEVEGSFGAIRFGSDDHASYNTATGLAFFQGAHINVYDAFGESGGPAAFVTNNRFGDTVGLHYYTPRISGFQAAISYHPGGGIDGGNDSNSLVIDDDSNTENVISVGANYVGDFDGISLTLSGGYDYVSDLDSTNPTLDDTDGWNVGGSVGYAGFTLGAFYQSALDEVGTDTDDLVFSGTYGTGPWSFGLQYGYFEQDQTGGYEADKFAGWAEYQLAPGVDIGAGVEYQDTDTGEGDSDGLAGMVIMGLSF